MVKMMSERFHDWLSECPTQWNRCDYDDDGSTYWFQNDNIEEDDE